MSRARRGERGAATLLAVAMAGVLLMVGAALAVVGALVVDHRRAQAAADLAALAGAGAAARGQPACAAARAVAGLNGAELLECSIDGPPEGATVTVRVEVSGPHWLGQQADLQAGARAGPRSRTLAAGCASSAPRLTAVRSSRARTRAAQIRSSSTSRRLSSSTLSSFSDSSCSCLLSRRCCIDFFTPNLAME